jgi:hypothetical protein
MSGTVNRPEDKKDPAKITKQMEFERIGKIPNPDDVQDRLYKMIDYGIGRVDYYEDQRHRLMQIGLGIMATGAALLALFSKLDIPIFQSWAGAWLSALTPLLTGVSLVYLFNRSIGSSYPYRKIVDIRSGYFTYNFPGKMDVKLRRSEEKARKQIEDVTAALKTFLDRWVEL